MNLPPRPLRLSAVITVFVVVIGLLATATGYGITGGFAAFDPKVDPTGTGATFSTLSAPPTPTAVTGDRATDGCRLVTATEYNVRIPADTPTPAGTTRKVAVSGNEYGSSYGSAAADSGPLSLPSNYGAYDDYSGGPAVNIRNKLGTSWVRDGDTVDCPKWVSPYTDELPTPTWRWRMTGDDATDIKTNAGNYPTFDGTVIADIPLAYATSGDCTGTCATAGTVTFGAPAARWGTNASASVMAGKDEYSVKTGSAATSAAGSVEITAAQSPQRNGNGTWTAATFANPEALTQDRYSQVSVGGNTDSGSTGSSSCAVTDAGGAKCWGFNGTGQVGNGSTSTTGVTVPTDVTGLTSGVRKVSVGQNHACAVMTDGTARCWGANGSGQLGINGTTASSTPVTVRDTTGGVGTTLTGVTDIAAGTAFTCAVALAKLYCWGNATSGKLGNNTTTPNVLAPQAIAHATYTQVTAVDAGSAHACMINNGAAFCWGLNTNGRVGDNSTTQRNVPTAVTNLSSGVTRISAGGAHTCAVHSGAAKCWGQNGAVGALGNNSTADSLTAAQVNGLTANVTEIDAGLIATSSSCAEMSDGTARCWGLGTSGQLGNSASSSSLVPVTVTGLSAALSISTSGNHTCATTTAGLYCWGLNAKYQLGLNNTTTYNSPQTTLTFTYNAYNQYLVSSVGTASNDVGWMMYLTYDGRLAAGMANGGTAAYVCITNNTLSSILGTPLRAYDNTNWFHGAGTYNASTITTYVNGIASTCTNSGSYANVSGQSALGHATKISLGNTMGTERRPFYGWLDDAYVHTAALSASQVESLVCPDADFTTATDIEDFCMGTTEQSLGSSTGNYLVTRGYGATFPAQPDLAMQTGHGVREGTTSRSGLTNTAFSGIGAASGSTRRSLVSTEAGTSDAALGTGSMTLIVWVRGVDNTYYSTQPPVYITSNNFWLTATSDGTTNNTDYLAFGLRRSDNTSLTTSANVTTTLYSGGDAAPLGSNTNRARMLAAVYDDAANTVCFYNNGELVGTCATDVSVTRRAVADQTRMQFAASSDTGSTYTMMLDDVSGYTSALSAQTIERLWLAGFSGVNSLP